ncbi:MAG: hypothetical protein KF749_01425 [Bacteroidetes bacterium]|nr:hypothetical protein [Bacteroidota bacterium]MCW5896174.1 hypothetical protein [Bacteroidota bacterium]
MRHTPSILLLLQLVIGAGSSQAGDNTSQFTFLPGRLLTAPLRASLQEPRVGLCKDIRTSRLKVDIGASVDMLEFRTSTDSTDIIRLGIDFFTYALSTNSEGLRLQIDAVDGFFGGHVTYISTHETSSRFTLRLRLLHLSAHFLDGHFNNSTQTWKDGRAPIPFTRDFGELLGMYDFRGSWVSGRIYAGISYATLIRPTEIKRIEGHGGMEFYTPEAAGSVLGRPFNLYLAYNMTLRGIPSYVATHHSEMGIKLGEWSSTGLRIFLSYYNGLDVFSQYYDLRREDWGVGVAFDFW